MIKNRLIVLFVICSILLGSFMLQVSAAEVKNAVSNPSFEDDVTSEWATGFDESLGKFEITTEEAHTGKRSLKVYGRKMPDAWWLTAYQSGFTLPAKTEITFSAWVKLEKGAGEQIMRFAVYNDKNVDIIANAASPIEAICNDREWTLIKGTYRAPVEVKNLKIGINYYPNVSEEAKYWGGAFYVDDVSVVGGAYTSQPGKKMDVPTEYETNTATTISNTTATVQATTVITTHATEEITTSQPESTDALTETTIDSSNETENTQDTSKTEDGSFNIWLVIVILVILAAVAAAVILIFKKKGSEEKPKE